MHLSRTKFQKSFILSTKKWIECLTEKNPVNSRGKSGDITSSSARFRGEANPEQTLAISAQTRRLVELRYHFETIGLAMPVSLGGVSGISARHLWNCRSFDELWIFRVRPATFKIPDGRKSETQELPPWCRRDVQHWDSSGAFLWLDFPIASGTGVFGWRLGINASILPNYLARSCAQVADSKASKSGSLTSIEVILHGGFVIICIQS